MPHQNDEDLTAMDEDPVAKAAEEVCKGAKLKTRAKKEISKLINEFRVKVKKHEALQEKLEQTNELINKLKDGKISPGVNRFAVACECQELDKIWHPADVALSIVFPPRTTYRKSKEIMHLETMPFGMGIGKLVSIQVTCRLPFLHGSFNALVGLKMQD